MTWLTVKTSGLSGRAKPDLICGKIFLFAISLLNYCTVSKIDIHVYNLLFITLWANSERCESAKIARITNIKILKNFFLVNKTAIINTQILTIAIKSSSRARLSLWFIDAFFSLKFYHLQISANQTTEPHCGRKSNIQPMIGQAIGPHCIIKLLETSPPSKLESNQPRMYQVMTALSQIR